jgi:tetratricopeptide (TPR) repeat protein
MANGDAYLESGDFQKAITCFEKARETAINLEEYVNSQRFIGICQRLMCCACAESVLIGALNLASAPNLLVLANLITMDIAMVHVDKALLLAVHDNKYMDHAIYLFSKSLRFFTNAGDEYKNEAETCQTLLTRAYMKKGDIDIEVIKEVEKMTERKILVTK